ncbi:MAG: hypothetical protein ACR2P1_24865 [Pseudomonadales bacterium]
MSNATNVNRKPTHRVITPVPGGKGKEPFFQRIGTGWQSDKGTIWLDFELMPTDLNASIGVRSLIDFADESS